MTLKILDASWHNPIKNRDARAEYKQKHIAGAAFFDTNECRDKSSPYTVMLPSAKQFEEYVGQLGIDNSSHVVVYDTYQGLRMAPRAWWMFRIFGHERISVLEGGLTKWISDGYPITNKTYEITPKNFTATYNPHLEVDFEEIYATMKSGSTHHVIDSRPVDWFNGMDYPEDEKWKSWHIPGSVNIPWYDFVDDDGCSMKSKDEIVKMFKQNNISLHTDPIKSTCRRGIYACTVALAAFVAGREDIPVYDGSWEEFSQRAKQEEYMTDSQY